MKIGAATVVNSSVINTATLSTGTTFVANATQVTITIPVAVNGSIGTSGAVLRSNGAIGSPYWGDALSTGGGYYKGNDGTVGDTASKGNIYRINSNTQSNNVTVDAGENALTAGPMTIAVGFNLTIAEGGRVIII